MTPPDLVSSEKVKIGGETIAVLYSEDVLHKRIKELAASIKSKELSDLLVITVLKGGFVFAADLMRELHRQQMTPMVEFISLSSYGAGTQSSGQVKLVRDVESDVAGRDILLVDDILESGRTMLFAKELLMGRGANSVQICVLLDKPDKRKVVLESDFCGFECPDLFVVGYGMDKGHRFRELPFIGVVM